MSSYGYIVMILGFCVSGSTAAVHSGEWIEVHEFESHLKQFFCSIIFLMHIVAIVKVTDTELQDIN